MKKRNIIIGLTLVMAISLGASVYAATDNNTVASSQIRLGLGRITSMRGYDYITKILKTKLGLSDADITNATNSGQTLYDLALDKGITEDELKTSLLEERINAIESAVSKGTITKEEGETLKANLKTNIQSCTGNFTQRQGLGQGRGMMVNGRGCLLVPSN